MGHGSKARSFDSAMKRVAGALRKTGQYDRVLCAFLEVSRPSIPEAIELAVRHGAREIRVMPYFVLTGKHVQRDIPEIIREAVRRHSPAVRIVRCPYLGYHSKIVSVVRQRIREGRS